MIVVGERDEVLVERGGTGEENVSPVLVQIHRHGTVLVVGMMVMIRHAVSLARRCAAVFDFSLTEASERQTS